MTSFSILLFVFPFFLCINKSNKICARSRWKLRPRQWRRSKRRRGLDPLWPGFLVITILPTEAWSSEHNYRGNSLAPPPSGQGRGSATPTRRFSWACVCVFVCVCWRHCCTRTITIATTAKTTATWPGDGHLGFTLNMLYMCASEWECRWQWAWPVWGGSCQG